MEKEKIKISQKLLFAFMLTLGFLMLYPLFFAVLVSVSTKEEYLNAIFLPIPRHILSELKNFSLIFKNSTLTRSLIITLVRIIWCFFITVTTSYFGGYAFAKLKFPFKRSCFIILIISMMIPGVALFVPNYVWMAKFPLVGGNDILGRGGSGYINNPIMYIFFGGWIIPYNIYLFRQSLYSLGNEMKEASEVDGAGLLVTMFKIYFPLVSPIVSVILLSAIVGNWSEYVNNTIYLRSESDWWTIGNIVFNMMNEFSNYARPEGADYPKAFAVSLISIVPPIVAYALLQKYVTEGLTVGAVKG